jgi:pimeloyl-ACP methyl ester carboxylesterase
MRVYNILGRAYDIYLVDVRGTQGIDSKYECQAPFFNPEMFAPYNCQDKIKRLFGHRTFDGFSVDSIANDHLSVIETIYKPDESLFVLGRGFGSYVVHRMLQINSTLIDAVVLDGLCAGPFCNASDWDNQRDILAHKILDQFKSANNSQSYAYQLYAQNRLDPLSSYLSLKEKTDKDIPVCGWRIVSNRDGQTTEVATVTILDQAVRPHFFAGMLQLQRCAIYDYGKAFSSLFSVNGDVIRYSFMVAPYDASFVSTNILLSEVMDLNATVAKNLQFSHNMRIYADNILKLGWTMYPQSPYRNSTATFNKPMLMMNGEYDPQAPLDKARQFANLFTAQGQSFVLMPGMGANSLMKSFMKNQADNITCAGLMIQQFFACPNCTIDTSCTNSMPGLLYEGDAFTARYFDPWNPRYIPPNGQLIAFGVLYTILFFLPVIVLVFVLVLFKNYRIKSRLIAPHIGLIFLLMRQLVNIIRSFGTTLSLSLFSITTILQDTLLVLACTIMLIQLIRFYAMTAIYRDMAKLQPSATFVRVIASKVIFGVILGVVAVIWLVFGIIMVVLEQYYGIVSTTTPYIYVSIVYAIVVVVISIALLVFDFIHHVVVTKCNVLSYFMSGDPLMFRFDQLLVIPIIILASIANFNQNIDQSIDRFITDQIAFILLCLYFGGTLVIAYFIDLIRKRTNKYQVLVNEVEEGTVTEGEGNEEDIIKKMLKNEATKRKLNAYCEKEFSLENIIAYTEVEILIADLKEGKDVDARMLELVQKYLMRSSPMELNVPAKVAKSIVDNANGQGTDDRVQLLETLMGCLMVNLLDTYSRFCLTPEFGETMKLLKPQNDDLKKKLNMAVET